MRRVLAVDPGLANTGIVLLEDRSIKGAWTITTDADGPRTRFEHAVERGHEIAGELMELHGELGPMDAVAVESYRDIPGHLRAASGRWSTPLTIGLLYPTLTSFGPVVWQDPETVMRAYAQMMTLWKAGRTGLVNGDELLQRRGSANEHCRSAAAHGLFLVNTYKAVN